MQTLGNSREPRPTNLDLPVVKVLEDGTYHQIVYLARVIEYTVPNRDGNGSGGLIVLLITILDPADARVDQEIWARLTVPYALAIYRPPGPPKPPTSTLTGSASPTPTPAPHLPRALKRARRNSYRARNATNPPTPATTDPPPGPSTPLSMIKLGPAILGSDLGSCERSLTWESILGGLCKSLFEEVESDCGTE
jgi:hypothetical protein